MVNLPILNSEFINQAYQMFRFKGYLDLIFKKIEKTNVICMVEKIYIFKNKIHRGNIFFKEASYWKDRDKLYHF